MNVLHQILEIGSYFFVGFAIVYLIYLYKYVVFSRLLFRSKRSKKQILFFSAVFMGEWVALLAVCLGLVRLSQGQMPLVVSFVSGGAIQLLNLARIRALKVRT